MGQTGKIEKGVKKKKISHKINKVSEAPFQIDACCGSYMVDAKSIMGMMAIGAGKKVELKIYSDEGIGNLEQLIRTYAA